MVIEALEGTHPRQLIEEGRSEEFVKRMAGSPEHVRRRRSAHDR